VTQSCPVDKDDVLAWIGRCWPSLANYDVTSPSMSLDLEAEHTHTQTSTFTGPAIDADFC